MMHHTMNDSRISTNMNKDKDVCDRLYRSVICRVEEFEVTRSHRRSISFLAVTLVAFLAVIPAIYYISSSISSSGFGKYMSLITSDGSYVLSNWKELMLSMASSLPLTGAMAILLALFITMLAIRRTISYQDYSNDVRLRLTKVRP